MPQWLLAPGVPHPFLLYCTTSEVVQQFMSFGMRSYILFRLVLCLFGYDKQEPVKSSTKLLPLPQWIDICLLTAPRTRLHFWTSSTPFQLSRKLLNPCCILKNWTLLSKTLDLLSTFLTVGSPVKNIPSPRQKLLLYWRTTSSSSPVLIYLQTGPDFHGTL